MNKKCIFIIFAACILVLGACFSAWRGDEGTISISIGGGEALGRAAGGASASGTGVTDTGDEPAADGDGGFSWPSTQPPPDNDNNPWVIESHTITLSGGPGPNQEQSHIRGGKTVHFSVAPGQWTITVKCFLEDKEAGIVSPDCPSYAEGSRTVNIKSGPNGVIVIPMSIKVIEVDDNPNSGKAGTLRWAIQDVVQMSKKNIDIVIDLDENAEINLTSAFSINENNGSATPATPKPITIDKSVTIRTKNSVTIKRAASNFSTSFFTIGKGGTLILDGPITIDGGNTISSFNGAQAPLITINGGTFIMNKDVTLQNNTNNSGNGGGVAVLSGTFTMNGGTIKGNTAAASGTPSTGGFGGGVYVGEEGTFSKTGGIIYGYVDNDTNSNKAFGSDTPTTPQGHAVYVTAVSDANAAAGAEPIRSEKKRNNTADNTVNLNSETEESWSENEDDEDE